MWEAHKEAKEMRCGKRPRDTQWPGGFRVVACVLSTSHGTDRDTSDYRKDVLVVVAGAEGCMRPA